MRKLLTIFFSLICFVALSQTHRPVMIVGVEKDGQVHRPQRFPYSSGGGGVLNLLLEDGKPMLLEDSKNILLGKVPNKPNVYIDYLFTLNNPKDEKDPFACAVICKRS